MIVRSKDNQKFKTVLSPTHEARVLADSGTFNDITTLDDSIYDNLGDTTPSLLFVANGSKVDKAHSVLPSDGSGDFAYTGGGNAVSQNADGTYVVDWPVNTPRYSKEGGMLVEPQRQLLITRPREFFRSAWTKINAIIEGDYSTITGDNLITSFANSAVDAYETFISSGLLISSAIETGTSGVCGAIFTSDANKLYVVDIDITINSGQIPFLYPGATANSAAGCNSATYFFELKAGNNKIYFKGTGIGKYLCFRNTLASDYSVTINAFKEVSAYACPFVNNLGVNTNEGFKFTATSANATLKLTTPYTTTAASTYTNSVFLKRVTGTGQVSIIDVNNVARPITITDEWQRYEYAAAASGTSGQIGIQLATSGDEVMVCHFQTELDAASTSPIYGTEGGLVTRLADLPVKTSASALIGQTEGTIYFEFYATKLGIIRHFFCLQNSPSWVTNSIRLETDPSNLLRLTIRAGSAIIFDISSTGKIYDLGVNKVAVAYKTGANECVVYCNGVQFIQTTAASIPALDNIALGHRSTNLGITSEFLLTDGLNNFQLYKTRLPNTKLIEMTAL